MRFLTTDLTSLATICVSSVSLSISASMVVKSIWAKHPDSQSAIIRVRSLITWLYALRKSECTVAVSTTGVRQCLPSANLLLHCHTDRRYLSVECQVFEPKKAPQALQTNFVSLVRMLVIVDLLHFSFPPGERMPWASRYLPMPAWIFPSRKSWYINCTTAVSCSTIAGRPPTPFS